MLFNEKYEETLSLESFEELVHTQYSLESLSELGNEGLLETLKSFLPTAFRTWFGIAKNLPTDDISILPREHYKFLKALRNQDYMDFRNLNLSVPTGLRKEYLRFVEEVIVQMGDFITKDFSKDLDTFKRYTGGLLNKPVETLRALDLNNLDAKEKKLDTLKDSLKEFIESNSQTTSVPYHELFKRNRDWEPLLTKLYNETYRINKMRPKEINKSVLLCQQHLLKFQNWLDKDSSKNLVTPEAVNQLASYTLMMAKSAELYTVFHHLLNACNTTMVNNIKMVQDSFSTNK